MDGNMQIDPDPEEDKRVSNFIFSTPTSPEKISSTGSFTNNVFTGSSKSTESSGFTFAKPEIVETSIFNFAKPTVFSNSDNNDTSMFGKPANEVSPFAKPALKENSYFSNPFTNTATSYSKPFASESSFGKSSASNTSPFAKPITSEASVLTKPATNESSIKSLASEASPFAKPSINEASPFAKPSTNEVSPFAKPSTNEASPFAKPSTNDTSPFAKPSTNEASPFAKPSIGESSPFAKSSTNDASPFAKPSTNETSPFAKPSISESSPFVKPSISESSPFVKPSISESSPFSKSAPNTQPTFGKSSADETSAFRKSSTSEISPFVKPSSNEASYFTKPSVNEDSLTEKSTIKETGKIPIHARLSKRSEYPDEPIVITDDDTSSSETTSEKSLKRSSLRSRRSSRSDLNASDIKKTSAFTQLQKNSKKTSDIKLDLANSITCSDVPESLLVKTVAKEYFEQFGNILKITIRPRRKIIVVYFSSKVTATKAFVKSGKFLNHEFKVEWTKPDSLSSKPKKVESFKKRITSFLNIDDDVKEELEALKGLEYNMPEPSSHIKTSIAKARVKKAMVVANREVPKRSGLISKSSLLKPSRTLHKEKSIPKPMPKAQAPVEESKLKFVTSLSIDELRKQIRQPALSSEDKYKVLDARDKLMRLKQNKQTSLATAKITQGTCPDMCPEKERYMREFQRQLATYEQMEPGSTDYKINHLTAVKQYSRSSADQEEPMAHDLRPLKSLKMTMSYLLHEISDLCDSDDVSLTEWYHYLWDRMRSIRKDITQQELCCVDTVELVEQCARFHILSSERLCAEETSVFDPKINSENLTKCLQTLKYMYYDLREAGTTCKNEPEFQAYVILLNLNNGSFVSDLSTLPPNIQKSDEVKFALSVYSALAMDNYSRFFKLVRQTTYLNGCILMRYFNQVRVKALNIMVKAYCRTSATTEYPLYELIDILGFEDEDEVNHFCNQTGLKCDRDNLYIKLKKDNFHQPDGQIEQGRAYNLILSKRQAINQAVGQCIAGGEWPEKIHINHQPHSSFDDNGYLLSNAYNAQDQGKTDVYDMMDEDGDVEFSEVKEIKKVEEKKLPIVNQTNSESTFKAQPMRSYASTTAPSASKPIFGQSQFSPPSSTSFRSPENKSFVAFSTPTPSIFSQSTHASTSMFNSTPLPQVQPANTTPFSNANSPFNMAVSKGIFSGYPASQTNVFGIAVQSVSSKMTTDVSNKTNEKQDNKRRHEDQLNQNDLEEKRRMMDRDEEERKKREIETAKRAEYEKQLRLELLNKRAAADCEMMQTEVLNDMCSEIVQAEMERIALMDALSSKIFNDLVQEICESLLDQQLFVQDMLIEVERRTRDRLCRKYLRCWRQCIDKRRLHRREALDNTPVWLQNESLEETAKKMYCPEMKIAVKYAKDNRRRSNPEDKISTESVRTPKQTPIEFVVCVGLKENTKNLAEEMRSNDYWKMVVSWPVLDNKLIVWRHKKLISQYLSPSDPTQEPIVIQHKFAGNESLTMCIRQFEGLSFEQSLTGTDALLLVCCADEDNRSVARRLTKAIVSREKLPPVPLVVLIFGDDQLECNSLDVDGLVEPLLESGHIGEYTVLKERSNSEEVVIRVLQSATLWLAINRASPVPLQMDFLHGILEDCISDDLWLKIHNHLGANEKFNNPLNDPNFVIDLHNEAINHLVDIMLDPESLAYTDFAPELKIYLGQNHSRAYPCGYEYFDILWKQPEYRAELERLISSFTFPRWNFPWPIHDPLKLHNAILAYSRQILSHESLTIARDIISNLYLISSFEDSDSENVEENKNVCRLDCFSEILVHIVERKIADLPSNVRVVYNKQHIQNFRKLPWWYKSNVLLNYLENQEDEGAFEITEETDHATTTQIEQSKSVSSVASEADDDEFHVDLELNELEQTIHEVQVERPIQVLEDEVKETNAEFEDWSKEFDRKLEEQLKRNEEFEARLKKALEDDDIVGTS